MLTNRLVHWIVVLAACIGLGACARSTPAPLATLPVQTTEPASATPIPATSTSSPATTATPLPATPPNDAVTPTVTNSPVISAPAGLVYTYGIGNGLWRVRADGQVVLLTDQHYPVLSPDQSRVLYAVGYEGDIWIKSLPDGPSRQLTDTPDVLEGNFQWWPANPGLIVFTTSPVPVDGFSYAGLGALNADGSGYRVLDAAADTNSPPALSPDGQTIAYARQGVPSLYRLDTGQPVALDLAAYQLEFSAATNPVWSADGQQLAWKAYGRGGGPPEDSWSAVAIFDLGRQTGRLLHRYAILAGSELFADLVWSPDGQWLAVINQAEMPGAKGSLWVLAADGSAEHHLSDQPVSPVWSPDSGYLIYTEQLPQASSFDEAQVVLVDTANWQPQPIDLPGGTQVEAWMLPQP